MALTGAMSAGIAGMRSHMDALTVVGNNVANVNTYGYKAGRVTFKESIYTTLSAGADGTNLVGGINPRQIGYGSSLGTIDLDMSTKTFEPTSGPLDVAITGDGFFMLGTKDGVMLDSLESLSLSRVGNFRFDADGYLVDGAGNVVYGFLTCNTNTDGEAGKAPNPGPNGNSTSTQLVPIRLPLAAAAPGEGAEAGTPQAGASIFPGVNEQGQNFYGDDFAGLECITAQDIKIDASGKITCINKATGDPLTVGYVALASVPNPGGLTHTEGPYYKSMGSAGDIRVDLPSGALSGDRLNNGVATGSITEENLPILGKGAPKLLGGFLEASGTDLASEFANMINYQRGYQANTRIISVTDTMLEELVNIKR